MKTYLKNNLSCPIIFWIGPTKCQTILGRSGYMMNNTKNGFAKLVHCFHIEVVTCPIIFWIGPNKCQLIPDRIGHVNNHT